MLARLGQRISDAASLHRRPFLKIGIYLGVAFAAYYVFVQPTETAALIRSALGGVGDAASGLAEFVRMLVSGS